MHALTIGQDRTGREVASSNGVPKPLSGCKDGLESNRSRERGVRWRVRPGCYVPNVNRNPTGPRGRSGSLFVERACELVTVPEIAARIGLSAGRVHELARDGELPAALGRIGGIQVWEGAVVEAKLTATRGLAPKRRGPKARAARSRSEMVAQ